MYLCRVIWPPIPTLFTYFLGFDIPTYSIIFIENVFIILVYIYIYIYIIIHETRVFTRQVFLESLDEVAVCTKLVSSMILSFSL